MSEYNITLPYTGFGRTLRNFLPREKTCLSVFDNQTVYYNM